MYPQQPQAPMPSNNYDFIMNPEKPGRSPLLSGKLGGNQFLAKIVFIVGAAVVLMIILAVTVNLMFGGRSNLESIVSIAQTEQEIARLGSEGGNASSSEVKNAAANTTAVIETHKQEWLAYLGSRGKSPKKDNLELKRDPSVDSTLDSAKQSSTFDTAYTAVMRSQLTNYANLISNTYDNSSSDEQRQILSRHYNDVKFLMKQWPE